MELALIASLSLADLGQKARESAMTAMKLAVYVFSLTSHLDPSSSSPCEISTV